MVGMLMSIFSNILKVSKMKLLVIAIMFVFGMHMHAQDPDFHIYLCFGQSNMEGNAKFEAQDTINIDERIQVLQAVDCPNLERYKGNWYKAIPPLVRCYTGLTPADYFGRTMIDSLPKNIKIGIVNVSIGGCKIELFDKDNYETYVADSPDWLKNMVKEYGDNPYARLVETAKISQEKGVVKGILLHQGESNTNDKDWTRKVKAFYDSLLKDLNIEVNSIPLLAGELLNTDQNGACASMNAIIATLPQVVPKAYIIPSLGCEGVADRLHFSANGYRELGKRYARQMLSIMRNEDNL